MDLEAGRRGRLDEWMDGRGLWLEGYSYESTCKIVSEFL